MEDNLKTWNLKTIITDYTNLVIAVDFDGTLCENNYPNIGKPNQAVIDFIKWRKKCGNTIILWTCRTKKNLKAAVKWCAEQGIVFDYINENTVESRKQYGNSKKINADIYIDDRNLTIQRIVTHYKKNSFSSAENAPLKQAEWKISFDGYYPYCSNCYFEPTHENIVTKGFPSICPHCGATMTNATKMNHANR